MLAGLPKAPSAYNPVANPKRAQERQQYVLRRMHELRLHHRRPVPGGRRAAPLNVRQGMRDDLPHACRVRRRDGPAGRSTSVRRGRLHQAASRSTRRSARPTRRRPTPRCAGACIDYDRRHGYRGPEAYVDLPDDPARARRGARGGASGARRQRRPRAGGRARGRPRARSRRCCADGDSRDDHRRRPQVRRPRAGRQGAAATSASAAAP